MTPWSDDRVETLKKLYAEGLSASQIAAQMGGITRNSIIGKVHRMGLPRRGRSRPGVLVRSHRKPSTRSATAMLRRIEARKHPVHPAPRRAPVAIEEIVVPISLHASLLSLTDQMCKWPIGDPAADGFNFCGHKNWNTLPYCEYHSRVAYQPADERRRFRLERMAGAF